MSRSEISVNAYRDAALLVDAAASDYRNRGYKRATALGLAAKALGVTMWRAKALVYGESVAVDNDDLARLRAAFLNHLDEEATSLSKRLAAIRARQQELNPAEIVGHPRRRHDDARPHAA